MSAVVRVVPELPVSDVVAAQRWYAHVLEATPMWTWQGVFGAVRLGDAELYVIRTRGRGPVTCYLQVEGADEIHAHVVAALAAEPETAGGAVIEPLEDREWAMREFVLRDPWGNSLRIGEPIAPPLETPGFAAPEDEPLTF